MGVDDGCVYDQSTIENLCHRTFKIHAWRVYFAKLCLYYQRHLWSQDGCGGRWILVFIENFIHINELTVNIVERTRNRPIASGRISVPDASFFLFAQYVIGVVFYYLSVDGLAWVKLSFGERCLIPSWDYLDSGLHCSNYCRCKCIHRADIHRYLIFNRRFAIYPLLKRYTHWPQAWLGFAMNFGFITAWISTTKAAIDWPLLASSMTACWWWVSFK